MDLPSWQRELSTDLFIIKSLLTEMNKVTPETDAKLQHLKKLIQQKLENPINDGNKKCLFSRLLLILRVTFTNI